MERRDTQPVLEPIGCHDSGPDRGYKRHTIGSNRRRRGVVLVWTAMVLLVMVGIVGLSLDVAKIRFNEHELHNAADAAALAGAQFVKADADYTTAHNLARWHAIALANENDTDHLAVFLRDNPGNDPSLDVVVGNWIRQTRTFTPFDPADPKPTNAVRVVARRMGDVEQAPRLRLIFGPAFGANSAGRRRPATAWSRGSTGAGIIVLAPDPSSFPGWNRATGLLMDGGTIVDLRGPNGIIGDIQVNSTAEGGSWPAFRLNGGSADIWAGEFNVVGTTRPDADDAGAWQALFADTSYPFSVATHSPDINDPLAGVPEPNIVNMPIPLDDANQPYLYTITDSVVAAAGGTLTLKPGYYPYGIDLRNQGNIVLTGGIYAFGGGTKRNQPTGLIVNGGSLCTAPRQGAMIYVTGDPSGSRQPPGAIVYGKIDISAGATVAICSRGDAMDPPQKEGEMGIAIWQDRNDLNYGRMLGNSASSITGAVYCGYNAMEVGGASTHMGNQLIAGALWLHGTVSLGIAYDGRNSIAGYKSFLVE
jgi:Flp pilus assembly protein TadG